MIMLINKLPYRLQGVSGNINPEVIHPTLLEGCNIQSDLTQ